MANINAQELQTIEILIPPITLQSRFVSIIENIEAQKAKAEERLRRSEALFQALLGWAFRGSCSERKREADVLMR